jgi:TctA family transporter
VLGILLGALIIQGIAQGPLLMVNNPNVFWGVVASMYIGNIMLLVLNLPLIGLWIQLLRVPYGVLFPMILTFCIIGVYGTTGSTFHLGLARAVSRARSRRVAADVRARAVLRRCRGGRRDAGAASAARARIA